MFEGHYTYPLQHTLSVLRLILDSGGGEGVDALLALLAEAAVEAVNGSHAREGEFEGQVVVPADEVDLRAATIGREDVYLVGEAAGEGGGEGVEELRRSVGEGVSAEGTDGDLVDPSRAAPYRR